MSMVVNHNIPALSTYHTLNNTNSALQSTIKKLSTGLRINSAADDAAGLAISEKMRAQYTGLDKAASNAQDGISMLQTAEGALNETHSILQRMRELSVQAANDTLTQQDRSYIQEEISQLRDEVSRIGNTTQFNKKKLLNGDAAVLWSSSDNSTKAVVKGGLRSIDQFGQKVISEGNYKIKVKTDAGKTEIQKSDIFKIKHENTIQNKSVNPGLGVTDASVDQLPSGDFLVEQVQHNGMETVASTTGMYKIGGAIAGTVTPGGGDGPQPDARKVVAQSTYDFSQLDAEAYGTGRTLTLNFTQDDGTTKSIDVQVNNFNPTGDVAQQFSDAINNAVPKTIGSAEVKAGKLVLTNNADNTMGDKKAEIDMSKNGTAGSIFSDKAIVGKNTETVATTEYDLGNTNPFADAPAGGPITFSLTPQGGATEDFIVNLTDPSDAEQVVKDLTAAVSTATDSKITISGSGKKLVLTSDDGKAVTFGKGGVTDGISAGKALDVFSNSSVIDAGDVISQITGSSIPEDSLKGDGKLKFSVSYADGISNALEIDVTGTELDGSDTSKASLAAKMANAINNQTLARARAADLKGTTLYDDPNAAKPKEAGTAFALADGGSLYMQLKDAKTGKTVDTTLSISNLAYQPEDATSWEYKIDTSKFAKSATGAVAFGVLTSDGELKTCKLSSFDATADAETIATDIANQINTLSGVAATTSKDKSGASIVKVIDGKIVSSFDFDQTASSSTANGALWGATGDIAASKFDASTFNLAKTANAETYGGTNDAQHAGFSLADANGNLIKGYTNMKVSTNLGSATARATILGDMAKAINKATTSNLSSVADVFDGVKFADYETTANKAENARYYAWVDGTAGSEVLHVINATNGEAFGGIIGGAVDESCEQKGGNIIDGSVQVNSAKSLIGKQVAATKAELKATNFSGSTLEAVEDSSMNAIAARTFTGTPNVNTAILSSNQITSGKSVAVGIREVNGDGKNIANFAVKADGSAIANAAQFATAIQTALDGKAATSGGMIAEATGKSGEVTFAVTKDSNGVINLAASDGKRYELCAADKDVFAGSYTDALGGIFANTQTLDLSTAFSASASSVFTGSWAATAGTSGEAMNSKTFTVKIGTKSTTVTATNITNNAGIGASGGVAAAIVGADDSHGLTGAFKDLGLSYKATYDNAGAITIYDQAGRDVSDAITIMGDGTATSLIQTGKSLTFGVDASHNTGFTNLSSANAKHSVTVALGNDDDDTDKMLNMKYIRAVGAGDYGFSLGSSAVYVKVSLTQDDINKGREGVASAIARAVNGNSGAGTQVDSKQVKAQKILDASGNVKLRIYSATDDDDMEISAAFTADPTTAASYANKGALFSGSAGSASVSQNSVDQLIAYDPSDTSKKKVNVGLSFNTQDKDSFSSPSSAFGTNMKFTVFKEDGAAYSNNYKDLDLAPLKGNITDAKTFMQAVATKINGVTDYEILATVDGDGNLYLMKKDGSEAKLHIGSAMSGANPDAASIIGSPAHVEIVGKALAAGAKGANNAPVGTGAATYISSGVVADVQNKINMVASTSGTKESIGADLNKQEEIGGSKARAAFANMPAVAAANGGADGDALAKYITVTATQSGQNSNILFEVTDVNTANTAKTITLKATANHLSSDGKNMTTYADHIVLTEGAGAVDLGDTSKFKLFNFNGDSSFTGTNDLSLSLLNDQAKEFVLGSKFVINLDNTSQAVDAEGNDAGELAHIEITGKQDSDWSGNWISVDGSDGVTKTRTAYSIDAGKVAGKDVSFKNYYLNSKTGDVAEGTVNLNFSDGSDGQPLLDATKAGTLASFETGYIGKVASADTKLRDIDKFWNSEGVFMLDDPKTITINQGDGKTTSVTIYANDTLKNVADKFNTAIGRDLGQAAYCENAEGGMHFATYIDSNNVQNGNNAESVEGTLVLRSVTPGADGRLSLAGDEAFINALSLNTIQNATESTYTVSVNDAHSGNVVASNIKITGNKLIGVVHDNVDVSFDTMSGLTASWSDTTREYRYVSNEKETTLHLADNSTVFQIGANEGEDLGVNFGDMRATALGLDKIIVTDRASAARAITVLDNAIDRVSQQRATIGAYQNRLEHTITNLNTANENLTSAESRIRDTDMAKEMMNFTKLQIMLQAGTSMLAQANQSQQTVLSLMG